MGSFVRHVIQITFLILIKMFNFYTYIGSFLLKTHSNHLLSYFEKILMLFVAKINNYVSFFRT